MKKWLFVFFLVFISPVFAEVISDFTSMCGATGYNRLYAVPRSFTCNSGYFLPANSYTCVACPNNYVCSGGTYFFNSKEAQGIEPNTSNVYDSSNKSNMCASNIVAKRMYAVPRSFTCDSGYFLPANTYRCRACPSGYTCSGGTYQFSATEAKGLEKDVNNPYIPYGVKNTCAINIGHRMNGTFVPNVHRCSAGQYLPSNVDECIQCPPNSYCPGGTYAFNETTAQGINPCPNNQTSLAGSSSVDQCKTVNLTWVSNGETYTTTTCTINGLITLPEPPSRAGYTFTGWKLQTNE